SHLRWRPMVPPRVPSACRLLKARLSRAASRSARSPSTVPRGPAYCSVTSTGCPAAAQARAATRTRSATAPMSSTRLTASRPGGPDPTVGESPFQEGRGPPEGSSGRLQVGEGGEAARADGTLGRGENHFNDAQGGLRFVGHVEHALLPGRALLPGSFKREHRPTERRRHQRLGRGGRSHVTIPLWSTWSSLLPKIAPATANEPGMEAAPAALGIRPAPGRDSGRRGSQPIILA